MKNHGVIFIICFLITQCCGDVKNTEDDKENWWKYTQLYQIYPRSFMDGIKNDGIGDLIGIKNKLEHLNDIGITSLWLSPIFVSPMKDFGYDIEDFYRIAEEYGTENDLLEVIAEGKKLGIKILLDYIPNHTSDQCEWFKKSVKREPGYEDFYVWHEGKRNDSGRYPPSNWVSVFRNSAWTLHPERDEYYLHQFLPQQPDLNYRNPEVIKEMNNVMKFWLGKGVSGFRIDAIPHLVESDVNEHGYYNDEPLSGYTEDENDYNYLLHTETRERDETWAIIHGWREIADNFTKEYNTETKILLMEAMSDIDIVMQYYGNATNEGAHFPFNFELTYLNQQANAKRIKDSINRWFEKIPEGRVTNWVAGNHDQSRLASRFGSERSDGVVMMVMLLPGVSVTYQGEEIAMTDQFLNFADTQDPQACKDGPDKYHLSTRDPCRTPFQWDNTTNAGFSKNPKTWLPVADNYTINNLLTQKEANRSPYKLYKILSNLRRNDTIKHGKFDIDVMNDDVLVFRRIFNDDAIVVIVNTGKATFMADVKKIFEDLDDTLKIEATSVLSTKNIGENFPTSNITLESYESLVFSTKVYNGGVTIATSVYMICIAILIHVFA